MSRPVVLVLLACVVAPSVFVYRHFSAEMRDVEAIGRKRMVVVELAEGATVIQTFAFPRDGLHSVTVALWSATPLEIALDFELRRRATVGGAADQPIAFAGRTILQPAGETWHTLPFPAIERAKDQVFAAVFRVHEATARGAGGAGTFGLLAWADDALRSGRLFVGSRERWGDLAFVAQAAPATRFRRMFDGLEANLWGDVRLGSAGRLALAALYWAVLVGVAGLALRRTGARDGHADPVPRAGAMRSTAALLLALGTPVLGAALALATRERVAVDLLEQLDTAAMESLAPLHEAFSLIEEPINGVMPRALFAHPPSKVGWPVTVPAGGARLRTAVALRPTVWLEGRSDGVTFNVLVDDGGELVTLYSNFVNPRERLDHRAWIPVEVDLSPHAGRSIRVILETTPGPSGDYGYDWAMWGAPRIVLGLAAR